MITVSEAESVITWDFDVIDGDVVFTVLRHKRPREASSGSVTSSGCLGESMSSRLSGVRPGIDAVVVERPIVCTQGESVQVCYLMIYVLIGLMSDLLNDSIVILCL